MIFRVDRLPRFADSVARRGSENLGQIAEEEEEDEPNNEEISQQMWLIIKESNGTKPY